MTTLQQRIEAFVKLGKFFYEFCDVSNTTPDIDIQNTPNYTYLKAQITAAKHQNGWFTKDNIYFGLQQWASLLTKSKLEDWLKPYDIDQQNEKTVALIMAGNIPLVGFHDFLAVLITGHKALIKLSSNDTVLLPAVAKILIDIAPFFKSQIVFEKERLQDFDAVIATGSNNTSRYFEYYFGNKPHIIRKNRNSIAILSGEETKEELHALGEDVFRYYGLGCRSVSKLMVPKGYNFEAFFSAIYDYNAIINSAKYANNYDYNKAVYLMSEFKLLENGFLMIKEDTSYASPIASLFYEYYEDKTTLASQLEAEKEQLQCIVAKGFDKNEIAFGASQKPELADYADGVDTVEFLLKTY